MAAVPEVFRKVTDYEMDICCKFCMLSLIFSVDMSLFDDCGATGRKIL
jgi:hypothetical protein